VIGKRPEDFSTRWKSEKSWMTSVPSKLSCLAAGN
jgi:hypothetical protein